MAPLYSRHGSKAMTISVGAVFTFLVTLVGVFSPIAAAASYAPIVGHFDRSARQKIAISLFAIVTVFVIAAVWIGELLIELVGVSTTVLSIVAGIAVLYAGIPMMRGIEHVPPEDPTDSTDGFDPGDASWKDLLFTPLTFPLTVGGATIAISVSSAAQAQNLVDLFALSAMGVVFGGVVAVTLYIGGWIPQRIGSRGRTILNRVAGILLTGIGVSLLVPNLTRLVLETVHQAAG